MGEDKREITMMCKAEDDTFVSDEDIALGNPDIKLK